jgi:hypothetical protein
MAAAERLHSPEYAPPVAACQGRLSLLGSDRRHPREGARSHWARIGFNCIDYASEDVQSPPCHE